MPRLLPAGEATGIWDGWRYRVHFFELRLGRPPELLLDNREIVAAPGLHRQKSCAASQ